ncbi:hypothetical protein J2D73_00270 [Acetobacter sacchari]|uniref:Putative adhesin Stv domain-containing protein n=1 Tax=Acetobacter sacchari TaxID=2661687 RepID=A0ABS3LQP2_9PROT|nr:hypothetical protein [Acetobacter sacchari]MBO1358232.1 hypothetical protein [Acetobacter sacchari]
MAIIQNKAEVGDNLYRFYNPEAKSRTCVISAHGLWSTTFGAPMRLGHNNVKLRYYSAHHHVVNDAGLPEYTSDRESDFETLTPDTSPDYLLFKYMNSEINPGRFKKHNKSGENYRGASYAATSDNVDIITIRNRHRFNPVRLSVVLKTLWANNLNYDEIRCVFCRGVLDTKIQTSNS